MTTTSKSKLNTLYTRLPMGSPITSAQLAGLGVSADLAVHYARSGWLKRLGPGVYCRTGGALSLPPGPAALQKHNPGRPVGGAPVSTPERALLELLDEVGVRQALQEAREITEGTYSLRAEVLMDLLKRCTSGKTVRLCLRLGRELSLPWIGKLDEAVPPKGGARPWRS